MGTFFKASINGLTGNRNGTAIDVSQYNYVTAAIKVTSATYATAVALQQSADGSNFATMYNSSGTAILNTTISYNVNAIDVRGVNKLRFNVSSYSNSSGAIYAWIGLNPDNPTGR